MSTSATGRPGSGTVSARTRDDAASAGVMQRAGRWMAELVKRPDFVTDLLQILKSVVAGTGSWWLSVHVLESPLPFLAPWVALLTVHATVYRSLSHGVQTTVASIIGVGLSFVIGNYLGVELWTFALALLVGLVGAQVTWIRDEGMVIATTAVFVLGSGFSSQEPLLLDRIIEVGLGVGVGVVVNLLIIPPLRDQQAARYVDSINRRMGEVLGNMAEELSDQWDTDRADAWYSETQSMSDELNSAWQSVRFARESRRANPRGGLRALRRSRAATSGKPASSQEVSYEHILSRVDEGISHLRHLARTLRDATYASGEWDERFRQQWVALVRDCGRSIADPDADVEPLADRLTELASTMSEDHELPQRRWPLYGALITSLRHIVVIVDDVASAREARESASRNPED
ncbi:MAG: aromatic acid exporter family protein [Micrococcaceae bacterium]|nr:aromatic acid exporter family protein [Micrococcaceae bacterium]MDN5812015.1 aromatic acid exporter family protein [Micrococcaceae bacterium]MDN5822829.1 aromatic acid exporter family protein [Micrococcaceae bacterium]MDN5880436.1 aromatic acid exporter family protein [Micrococcaceae bacterium]MDN6171028.1 aromatic acid exporter family protein [Micrococcaceae bacterium]